MDTHALVGTYLFPALVIFTAFVAYVVGVRPALKQNPKLKDLYDSEATWLDAVSSKFSGIKQKLVTVIGSAASLMLVFHDQITKAMSEAGVDPVVIGHQILPNVPTWVWPMSIVAILWLVQYFRSLADKQAKANAEALLNAGQPLAAPAPGVPIPPLSLPDKPE